MRRKQAVRKVNLMSTIDRVSVYDKPCPCGEGKIVLTECSPDHPYARDSQTVYKGKLDCINCNTKYKIDEIDKDDTRSIILMPYDDSDIIYLLNINRFCGGLSK